jgi:hypothetical protein
MKIQILPGYTYSPLTTDLPEPGKTYILTDDADGTERQNRAFHALVLEYWKSGCASYPSKGFEDFRNEIKKNLGAGFEAFVYAVIENDRPVIKDAKTWDEIPEGLRVDPDKRAFIRGRLKSWSDYVKKERIETIDNLIREMVEAGVNSKKFDEIISGMQERS